MIALRRILPAFLLLLVVSAPARAEKKTTVLEDVTYPTAALARTAWSIGHRNTPAVELVKVQGNNVLRLPCNFKDNTEWRVAWDLRGQWNLSGMRHLVVRFAPGNKRGLALTIYLHNADGWYSKRTLVPVGGREIRIGRHEFTKNRQSGHLDSVDRLRISVNRDKGEDSELRLAGIRAVSYPSSIAVYQSQAGGKRESGTAQFVRLMTNALERLGVDYELLSDTDVARGRLDGKKVAILPLNAEVAPDAAKALKRFVAGGGKLIACYTFPAPIGELLGVKWAGSIVPKDDGSLTAIEFRAGKDGRRVRMIQNSWRARKLALEPGTEVVGTWVDAEGKVSETAAVTRNANGYFVGHVLTAADPPGKDAFLIEMLNDLWPGVWEGLYEQKLDDLGRLAGLSGVDELKTVSLRNVAATPNRKTVVTALLKEADDLCRKAHAASQRGDSRAAHETLRQAHDTFKSAYAASVPSRPGEVRAVWCHSPEGLPDRTWDESLKLLAAHGFNTIIPNMCWGDGVAYKSKLLPMVTETDELAECLKAAKKHGIAVHVWRVNWRFWHGSPKGFRQRMEREGRVQKDAQGKTLTWLCPSNEANRKLEVDAMLEIVRNYDVDGIHFDYIRYPGRQGCYCEHCRKRFEEAYNLKVKNWPADVIDGDLRDKYLQFRRDNITAVVAEVSRQAHKLKPGIKVSAAVFHDWASARDNVGQDWKLWVEKGYLDFVCPMQYTTDPVMFEHQLQKSVGWVDGRTDLLPGIGATLSQSDDGTLQQVLISRRYKTAGFVLFNYYSRLARDQLPLLKAGATAD